MVFYIFIFAGAKVRKIFHIRKRKGARARIITQKRLFSSIFTQTRWNWRGT